VQENTGLMDFEGRGRISHREVGVSRQTAR
jgi:hypothetical protein